jgi:hypothetical protein
LQAAGDFRFAETCPMSLSDFGTMPRRLQPAKLFTVRTRIHQTSPSPFPQNFPFELEASRAAMARPAGVVKSCASVRETKPTPR